MKKSFIILGLIALVGIGSAFYFYRELSQLRAGNQGVSKEDMKVLLAEVGELIVLPEGEEPSVFVVSDPKLLEDQPFFANAKVGNKVLIYTKAKKAILYDPELKKIVDVAPINFGDSLETR